MDVQGAVDSYRELLAKQEKIYDAATGIGDRLASNTNWVPSPEREILEETERQLWAMHRMIQEKAGAIVFELTLEQIDPYLKEILNGRTTKESTDT